MSNTSDEPVTIIPRPAHLSIISSSPIDGLTMAGQAANRAAANGVFADYLSRRALNTVRSQTAALSLFALYLTAAGVDVFPAAQEWAESQSSLTAVAELLAVLYGPVVSDNNKKEQARADLCAHYLQNWPSAWQGVTWGLTKAFALWLLDQGHSIASVNQRLTAVKVYAGLANQAGALDDGEYQRICSVKGYGRKESKRIDEQRPVTRIGHKKAEHVTITAEQAHTLKTAHDTTTAQGARDRLLMCLLLDHGLRVGEVSELQVNHLDLKRREMRFYRPKVDKVQTHKLSHATMDAARTYLAFYPSSQAISNGRLLLGSTKSGNLTKRPMTNRAITKRVCFLGKSIAAIPGFSPHDCRHFWATDAAKNGTDPFRLQEAGGWSSLDMPRRYIEDAKIANVGVKLTYDE